MIRSHKVVQTLLVHLASLAMLISGAPHFDCLCPDGHLMLFCAGCSSSNAGRCCADAAGSRFHQTVSRGICCRQARQHGRSPIKQGAQSGGCRRTMAEGDVATVTPSHHLDNRALSVPIGVPLRAPTVLLSGRPFATSPWMGQCLHSLVDQDLVIAHQHFLI
jgi:hypothetical protein